VKRIGEITEAIEEGNKALREKNGLTQREVDGLREVISEVSTMRLMWKKTGGDKMIADMEKQMKAQLKTVRWRKGPRPRRKLPRRRKV